MFYTRKAIDVRDKVYAVLGMSRDDPDLRPNYEVSWKEVFQQLVKLVHGKGVSAETSDYSQRAVIKSKGCILGWVSSVIRSDDRQSMTVTSKNRAWYSGEKLEWTLQASAKSIQEGDIVSLLQGASKPTIIRLCKDHFAVVIIAATPLNIRAGLGRPKYSKSEIRFPRDFRLIWDLENPVGESQDREDYETLIGINHRVS
jgi:hypothetical protein